MNYFDVYGEIFRYHKRFSKVQSTDEYWQQAMNESQAIAKKYKEHPFVIDLLVSVLMELERTERKVRTQ